MVVHTAWSSSTISSFGIGWGALVGLHNHGKARAFAGSTGHLDAAAVLENDLLHDREPDARAGFAGSLGPLGPIEFLENTLDFLGIHADSLILNRQPQFAAA